MDNNEYFFKHFFCAKSRWKSKLCIVSCHVFTTNRNLLSPGQAWCSTLKGKAIVTVAYWCNKRLAIMVETTSRWASSISAIAIHQLELLTSRSNSFSIILVAGSCSTPFLGYVVWISGMSIMVYDSWSLCLDQDPSGRQNVCITLTRQYQSLVNSDQKI
jgi:hypothetical protein